MGDTFLHFQHGSGNRYPFRDTATLTSSDDNVITLPFNMFNDAIIYAPGGTDRQFINSINKTKDYLEVVISDTYRPLCSGKLKYNELSREVPLYDAYGRPCGILIGSADIGTFIGAIPDGTYIFNLESTEFVPSCVIPQPQINVSGFLINDRDLVSGNVWLVGKGGVVLSTDPSTNTIIINLVGDPLFTRRKCLTAQTGVDNPSFIAPTPLKEIRVILEDADNAEIRLLPDEIGSVFITPGSHQAEDNVIRAEQQKSGIKFRALGNVIK